MSEVKVAEMMLRIAGLQMGSGLHLLEHRASATVYPGLAGFSWASQLVEAGLGTLKKASLRTIRPDAYVYIRPDAYVYIRPDAYKFTPYPTAVEAYKRMRKR